MKDQGKRFTILAGIGVVLVGALAGGCGSQGDDATSGEQPATGTTGASNSAPAANSATVPGATPLVPPADVRPRKGPD